MHKWKTVSVKIMGIILVPTIGASLIWAQAIDETSEDTSDPTIGILGEGVEEIIEEEGMPPLENLGLGGGISLQETTSNDPLEILTGDLGYLGVGTTAPLGKMHISALGGMGPEDVDGKSERTNAPLIIQGDSTVFGLLNGDGRSAMALNISYNNHTNDHRGVPTFYDKYDGDWHRSLTLMNGDVGIGVSSPTETLDVGGNILLRNMSTGAGSGNVIHFASYGATHPGPKIRSHVTYASGVNSRSKLILSSYAVGDKEELTLYKGNVGVGVSIPAEPLDVAGNIKLSGNIVSDGDICFGNCQ